MLFRPNNIGKLNDQLNHMSFFAKACVKPLLFIASLGLIIASAHVQAASKNILLVLSSEAGDPLLACLRRLLATKLTNSLNAALQRY